ncbi:hypothetical protein [Mariniplasma anaerobium]|uniref:Uncharacterized protein n=1 Tax=Mariniplasma anaerobium TaxID=2735436 RepID=A0A7U9XVE2_9MOLU|nr:hypothetical protein [Mariniplasma anaerobium]BCR35206.1 hypothetical protein MPAN_000990 [Mariniplasma anaerobium]
MEKKEFILPKYDGKIYFMNKENEEKIKSEKRKVYTEDKQFALVYTEKDIKSIIEIHEFIEYQNYEGKRSYEDEIYDWFILELGIDKHRFYNWGIFGKNIDKNVNLVLHFTNDEIMCTCLINKQDSLKEGSDAIYGVGSNDTLFLTLSIGTKKIMEEDING